MIDYSILIGGKAGDGITQAGQVIGSLFTSMGYHVYLYVDYQSLIRGGHNFCIIRLADRPVSANRTGIDILLALDQQTVDLHAKDLNEKGIILFDAERVHATGQGVAIEAIIKKFQGRPIMKNTAIIGALCGIAGIPWNTINPVLMKNFPKETEKNLSIAEEAHTSVTQSVRIPILGDTHYPLLSGNEWISLGLLAGGLDAYIAYPMTPSSGILHFLASVAEETGIIVYHPESEIAVILMALGFAYAGKKAAVGTSGGGFCLMTEGLSLAGQAEIPIVIVLAERAGPSTGIPTYNAQTDLLFACHAGHGEFPRYIIAPGTPGEAYQFSAIALTIAWKYQIPSIILSDKTFSEGYFSCESLPDIVSETFSSSPSYPYRRYAEGADGISPLLAPPFPGEVIKVNSYTHDPAGITTEDPQITRAGIRKRLAKAVALSTETDTPDAVYSAGPASCTIALLCWGSTRGVVHEVAVLLNLRIVSPIVLAPFPKKAFNTAIEGVKTFILVEESANGQLDKILSQEGFVTHEKILRYDGRPFPVEELTDEVRRYTDGKR